VSSHIFYTLGFDFFSNSDFQKWQCRYTLIDLFFVVVIGSKRGCLESFRRVAIEIWLFYVYFCMLFPNFNFAPTYLRRSCLHFDLIIWFYKNCHMKVKTVAFCFQSQYPPNRYEKSVTVINSVIQKGSKRKVTIIPSKNFKHKMRRIGTLHRKMISTFPNQFLCWI